MPVFFVNANGIDLLNPDGSVGKIDQYMPDKIIIDYQVLIDSLLLHL